MKSIRDILWRIINKIDLSLRYIVILIRVRKVDIVLTATSAQTNLGDHAISIAVKSFLKDSFKELSVVEIPKEIYIKYRRNIVKKINDKAIIVVTGGGFLGDLWMTEETLVRNILEDFNKNKLIIFPQTIFFKENSIEYETTFNIYKKVSDLIINVRDINSFNLMRKELPSDIVNYIPDMVLSLKFKNYTKRQNIALMCIRKDKENCLSYSDFQSLTLKLKQKIKVKETTTICNHIVPISLRKIYVYKKLKEISKAKIIVTNRLHMMIFAAITGTPCIAIDNLSKKVSGVYNWIKDLSYIKLIDNIENFDNIYDELIMLEKCEYDQSKLSEYYLKLKNEFGMETRL